MPGIIPVPAVTRGFGPKSRIVTASFGPLLIRVIAAIKDYTVRGASAIRRLPEILWTVYARLSTVNERELASDLEGVDKRIVDPNLADPQIQADLESTGINRRPSGIVIVAEHVRHGKKEGLK